MQPYRLIALVARSRGSISPRRRILASETQESFDATYVVLMTFNRWFGNDRAVG